MAIYAKDYQLSFPICPKFADYLVNASQNIMILKEIIKKVAMGREFLNRWVDFWPYICYN